MTDPLAEIVTLLRPSAGFSKLVTAYGDWRVSRSESGRPFYCVVLEGASRLTIGSRAPVDLRAGDFVLVPAAYAFTMASLSHGPASGPDLLPVQTAPGEFRLGREDADRDARMVIGYCSFRSHDATLLVSLLPEIVHVRGESRLASVVQLIAGESRQRRPGRELILSRLLEVLLIEAFRSVDRADSSVGLVRGLADAQVAVALRRIHEQPAFEWRVERLAKEAGLSRSTFFERFKTTVGIAPMEYVLAWRMALAKDLLAQQCRPVATVAEQVGYGSATTFSVAFSRHVGMSPSAFARAGSG